MENEWEPIGEVGVDSATLWIGDPAYLDVADSTRFDNGVSVLPGKGDGTYQVLARYADVPGYGRRIAELRIVFIT